MIDGYVGDGLIYGWTDIRTDGYIYMDGWMMHAWIN